MSLRAKRNTLGVAGAPLFHWYVFKWLYFLWQEKWCEIIGNCELINRQKKT